MEKNKSINILLLKIINAGDEIMIEVKKTSIHIPIDTLIKIKSIAVKKGTTQNNVINELINKGLEKNEKIKGENKPNETAIERIERLTNGKAEILNKDTYNPNPTKKKLNSIVGLMDAPEGFDVVKAVEDANVRK